MENHRTYSFLSYFIVPKWPTKIINYSAREEDGPRPHLGSWMAMMVHEGGTESGEALA